MSRIFWNDRVVPFRPGETIAAALGRAGILSLGPEGGPVRGRVFCGIGACQACVVSVEGGAPVEACLTLATGGLRIGSMPAVGGRND
ncbi:2Fe-2S iron-sulfur cluster-binding protein [Bosea sp. LC85]|uniref:2Fe-2S iron-sulfur cluster-binding protein n=1 Tax=Bosea sp. LC85 TaxID=1502851 RepID=UPI0005BAFDB0|nr:2Fe-2S iron-sulfur cluster-binding protein [Bosea sp. LC85]